MSVTTLPTPTPPRGHDFTSRRDRDAEKQDEAVAMIAVVEGDVAQCTLIRAFIRAKVKVAPTSSLICPTIVEILIYTALIVNV